MVNDRGAVLGRNHRAVGVVDDIESLREIQTLAVEDGEQSGEKEYLLIVFVVSFGQDANAGIPGNTACEEELFQIVQQELDRREASRVCKVGEWWLSAGVRVPSEPSWSAFSSSRV